MFRHISLVLTTFSLLEPIGHYRRIHIHPSKGPSRNKKRKRYPEQTSTEDGPPPPSPELSKHILVGLNSVTRHLSTLAAKTAPSTIPVTQWREESRQDQQKERSVKRETPRVSTNDEKLSTVEEKTGSLEDDRTLKPFSIIILPHPSPASSLPHAHLPTLIYLSTLSPASRSSTLTPTSISSPTTINQLEPTRLVTLPSASETRLATALNIPRCGAIGILEDAPGAEPLVSYVREHVGLVECKWVEEGMKAEWKGVKTSTQDQDTHSDRPER